MYKVYVDGIETKIHKARVSAYPLNKIWDGIQRPLSQTEEAYFLSVDIDDPVSIEIEVLKDFDKFEIRPLSLKIPTTRNENIVKFLVEKPMQLTFEVDGSHCALHIFVNTISIKPDGDIIYFGPGEHKADLIWLESGQTLYIDKDSVVYGCIYAKDAHNIKIVGRGILDSSPYCRPTNGGVGVGDYSVVTALKEKGFAPLDVQYTGNLTLNNCKDVLVEGIVLREAPMWSLITHNNCEHITIDNIKIIGQWRYNSDGIDICTSKNVIIKNSFIRSFDDAIVARGAYLTDESRTVENMRVENCVIWCDWGKSLEVWCGHKPTSITNIMFKDIYMIHLSRIAMSITTWYGSESSVVENVKYQNIYIDEETSYLTPEVETAENPIKYEFDNSFRPKMICICLGTLGKLEKLGSQEFVDCDISSFKNYYSNIIFDNIKYNGIPLIAEVEEQNNNLKTENIIVKNSDFTL